MGARDYHKGRTDVCVVVLLSFVKDVGEIHRGVEY